jgi:hypothetical protein
VTLAQLYAPDDARTRSVCSGHSHRTADEEQCRRDEENGRETNNRKQTSVDHLDPHIAQSVSPAAAESVRHDRAPLIPPSRLLP